MAKIEDDSELSLMLGDIIQIQSSDMELHNYKFFINYIDDVKIEAIREDGEKVDLVMEDGAFIYDDISDISILSREEFRGYARQNGLLPGTWIKILFNDDYSIIGKIEDIQEDRIEISTDTDKVYIDFGYGGIPPDLGIVQIYIIDEPENVEAVPDEAVPDEAVSPSYLEDDEIEEGEVQVSETDELDHIEESNQSIQPSELVFGPVIGTLSYEVIAPVEERRFGIDKQTTDMLNGYLSRIPAHKRTQSIMRDIMRTIERYTELRDIYTGSRDGGEFDIPDIISHHHKPAINHIMNMNKKLLWCIPVTDHIKNIYDTSIDDEPIDDEDHNHYTDLNLVDLSESQKQIYRVIDAYRSNPAQSGINNFYNRVSTINKEFIPLLPPLNGTIYEKDVATNILALCDTMGGFDSNVVSYDNIRSVRYVTNEYVSKQTGIEIVKSRGESHIITTDVTPADRIYVKSMVTLPISIARFGNVHSLDSTILDKSNIDQVHPTQWKLFHNHRRIQEIEVNDTDITNNTMRKITNYIPKKGLGLPEGYFREFLNSVVPPISTIIEEYSKYTKNNNVQSIVRQLSPFLINMRDINYTNYKTLGPLTLAFNTRYKQKYNKLLTTFYAIPNERNKPHNYISWMLGEYRSMIQKQYPFNHTILTAHELYNKMMHVDDMRSYKSVARLLTSDLFLQRDSDPEEMTPVVSEPIEKCDRVLSKVYNGETELQRDNGIITYFDKQYDRTMYEIMDKYAHELESLSSPEEQATFISSSLIKNYGFSEEMAETETNNIMSGRKEVNDGHYAIVRVPNEPDRYYKRGDDLTWNKTDNDSRDEMSFCNTSSKCIAIKGKCMDKGEAKDEIVKDHVNDDDSPETIDISEYKSKTMIEIENNIKMGILLLRQIDSARVKYDTGVIDSRLKSENVVKLPLGWEIKYSKQASKYFYTNKELELTQWERPSHPGDMSDTARIESPHAELRDMIIAQRDFEKKQSDILRFSSKYTRPSVGDEDPNWLYCNETGIKLIPIFLPQLAQTYMSNGGYEEHLARIVSERGTIGGCGGHIVDKSSGYIIMARPFDTSDEYTEEGFKDVYRSVLEDDLGDIVKRSSTMKDVYGSKDELQISNIINAMVKFMGIRPSDDTLHSVLADSMKLLSIVDKSIRRSSATTDAERETKQLLYNKSMVVITLSYLHIHIQTSIPSISSTMTYPGCKKSFGGYPTYDEPTGGIEYVGCIAYNVKSQIEPWNGISKMSKKKIVENIRGMIEKFILPDQDIKERIKRKLDYYEIDESQEIKKTDMLPTFLPPLRETSTKPVAPISESHISSIVDDLKRGHPSGIDKVADLKSNIIPISNIIREKIQGVVHKDISLNDAVLVNNMGEPYTKNACCSDNMSPISYMMRESSDVTKYIHSSLFIAQKMEYFRKIGKPYTIFDDTNTRRVFKKIGRDVISPDVIYRFIIDRCKYDTDLGLPIELNGICLPRPVDYDKTDTIYNKIEKLKTNGYQYDNDTFNKVLKLTTSFHNVRAETDDKNKIQAILDDMGKSGESIFPEAILADMYDIFGIGETDETYEKKSRDMKNYLSKEIKQCHVRLIAMMRESGLPRREITNITKCIEKIFEFSPIGNGKMVDVESETGVHTIEFVKSMIEQLGVTLPNIIMNRCDYSRIKAPKYWKLSMKHMDDFSLLMRKYYEPILSFYSNELLDKVLSKYVLKSIHINKLVNALTYVTSDNIHPDATLTLMIAKYSTIKLLLTLNEISDVVGSDEMLSDQQQLTNMTFRCTMRFLNIVCIDKETINYNYHSLMDRIGRAKEKEKNEITDYLKDMTKDARNVESVLKQHKLGKWSLGEQKGYREYQGDMYDKERDMMDQQLQREISDGRVDVVSMLHHDIYDSDKMSEIMEDREINDISHIGEDNDNAGEELDIDEEF